MDRTSAEIKQNAAPAVQRLDPPAEQGLSSAQAKERLAAGLSNVSSVSGGRSVAEIIKDNLFTFFNLIFAVLAVLLIIAGSYKSLTFLPVVIANIVIGTVQESATAKSWIFPRSSWCWTTLRCSARVRRSALTPL